VFVPWWQRALAVSEAVDGTGVRRRRRVVCLLASSAAETGDDEDDGDTAEHSEGDANDGTDRENRIVVVIVVVAVRMLVWTVAVDVTAVELAIVGVAGHLPLSNNNKRTSNKSPFDSTSLRLSLPLFPPSAFSDLSSCLLPNLNLRCCCPSEHN
jgi:hypothetical protein